MEREFTNLKLSEKLGISLTKVRRLAKDFLPPDPVATRQSGKARWYGVNEAFDIYLGHHLITRMKFRIAEAKAIHRDIAPWMKRKGIYPMPGPDFEPDEYVDVEREDGRVEEVPHVHDAIIHIMVANTDSGFFYEAIRDLSEKTIKKGGMTYIRREFRKENILPPPKGKELIRDDLNLRILDLNKLRYDFNMKILLLLPY